MVLSKITPILVLSLFLWEACKNKEDPHNQGGEIIGQNLISYPNEKYFTNVRQLTFGGNNAEAYWSFDGSLLCFQSDFKGWNVSCDQIFYFNPDKDSLAQQPPTLISKRGGRTTCSYFLPGDSLIIFASTHGVDEKCPQVPERKKGGKYLWPVYGSYEIYVNDLKGNLRRQYTHNNFYDAEATVSPKGDKIVFTSDRSGDLELWIMDIDGRNQKQITNLLGYDGGAFFSPDGKKLVFRASRPTGEEEIKEYKDFLAQGLVQPTKMEIYTCNVDGSDLQQITKLGKANWAPYFTPDGTRIIFSSNHAGSKGFNFNLFLIHVDGSELEQVSFDPVFDSFPMFSPDGKRIAFSSNRNNQGTHDTNLFIANWIDTN
ncbi:MAG: hypothetical protein M3Q56_07695 [Bacteroidota bacterium]|nr:hypothetical protein [Bacteroidota bacterium]